MNHKIKSAIATALIQGAVFYALIVGLAMTIPSEENEKLNVVELRPEPAPAPPPQQAPPPIKPYAALAGARPPGPPPDAGWASAGAIQREAAFIEIQKWRDDNMSEEQRRTIKWRAEVPQGSGPGRVTRVQPANLATHTLYWPARWTRGKLPIVAWGNGQDGKCANSSLAYAAFLSEIASHGYFVVAVGNDDIDFPQPEGLEILADGRPVRTQPGALTRAVDWAIGENGRAGSPYAGKLDPGKVAYIGHGCGGLQALQVSSDPRTTTTVVLNATARFRPDATQAHKPPLAHFEGTRDDGTVLEVGEANFARAQAAGWPMFKAALGGIGFADAYPGPDRRWTKAVLAWLNWQLKGDKNAAARLEGVSRDGWSRIETTALASEPVPTPSAAP